MKYINTRNTISFSVSKISFISLVTPIDSNKDGNVSVELFKATLTHSNHDQTTHQRKNLKCFIFTIILETFKKFGGQRLQTIRK